MSKILKRLKKPLNSLSGKMLNRVMLKTRDS